MGVRSLIRADRTPVPFIPRDQVVGSSNGRVYEYAEGTPIPHAASRIDWDTFNAASMPTAGPLSVPVYWDCLNLVSESVATLDIDVFKIDDHGTVQDRIYPTPPILANPFPPWGRVRWLSFIVRCLLMRGNAFALLGDFDSDGYPRQAAPINPERMTVMIADDGRIYYRIGESGSWMQRWPNGPIFHVGGYQMDDGPLGVGVIDYGSRTTEMSYKTFDYITNSFAGAGVPSGVITVDEPEMTQERADDIWTRWTAAHSSVIRRPAVVPSTMTFQPLSMNFTDADIAAVRTLNALDVCHLFGVPSWLVNVAMPGASQTYSNAEQQQAVFKVMTLTRWTSRLERWGSDLLPGRVTARFDFSEMLRSTTSEQYAAWMSAIETGILTINEVRNEMHRPPVPGGDALGSVSQQSYVAQTAAYAGSKAAQGQSVSPEAQNVA